MKSKAGLAWECELLLNRYLEDSGIQCELVTPHMLAAPYFRGTYVSLVIPTGFANPNFSKLLPALRASAKRMKKFIESGGNLIVFGAMDTRPDSYDWLPFKVTYIHEYFRTPVVFDTTDPHCSILDEFNANEIECDGYFSDFEGKPIARSEDGKVLMLCNTIGNGTVIVTSFHEYPSKTFMKSFCTADRETLF